MGLLNMVFYLVFIHLPSAVAAIAQLRHTTNGFNQEACKSTTVEEHTALVVMIYVVALIAGPIALAGAITFALSKKTEKTEQEI